MEKKGVGGILVISNTAEDTINFMNILDNSIYAKVQLKALEENQLKQSLQYKRGIVGPWKLVYHQSKGVIYSANKFDNSISIIDIDRIENVDTIFCGTYPTGIAIDDKNIYVTNGDSNCISIIDADTRELVSQVGVGEMPIDTYFCHRDDCLIVALYKSNAIAVMNKDTHKIKKISLKDTSPLGITAMSCGYIAYGFNNTNNKGIINVIDKKSGKSIKDFHVPSMPLGLISHKGYIYCSDGENGEILKINIRCGNQQKLWIGGMPQALVLDEKKGIIYVVDSMNGEIKMIDILSFSVTNSIYSGAECCQSILIKNS